mgnify:CR=1 FL=1
MKCAIFKPLAFALIFGLGWYSPPLFAEESQAALKAGAKITQGAAAKTALEKVPNGIVESAWLERDHGMLLWSFYISIPNSTEITEVRVEAATGEIISICVDSPEGLAKRAAAHSKEGDPGTASPEPVAPR